MKTINKCLEAKVSVVGSRPAQGKMIYLSKLIKKLIDDKKKTTLFALEGSENWYLSYLLAEITGLDKKVINRYLYPCVFTGKEKGPLINRNKYIDGIEYLQKSDLFIKNYNWISPSNINTLNVLELIIEEIKNIFDDVDWIIVDRLDDVVKNSGKSREEILNIINEELKLSDVSMIIVDTLKREKGSNINLSKDSFVNYELIDKYSDRMIIIYDYKDYLIK